MAGWLDTELTQLGVQTKPSELGTQQIQDQTYDLPPAILGRIGTDPNKKTVLIYGHYDVQPVCS